MRLIDFLNRSLWSDLLCENRIKSLDNGCPISDLLCESIHYSFLIRFFYSVDSLVRSTHFTVPIMLSTVYYFASTALPSAHDWSVAATTTSRANVTLTAYRFTNQYSVITTFWLFLAPTTDTSFERPSCLFLSRIPRYRRVVSHVHRSYCS